MTPAPKSARRRPPRSLAAGPQASGFAVVGTSRNRLNVDVTGSVANIEAAFHLTLGVYQDPTANRTFYAPDREPTLDLPVQLIWGGADAVTLPARDGLAKLFRNVTLVTTLESVGHFIQEDAGEEAARLIVA